MVLWRLRPRAQHDDESADRGPQSGGKDRQQEHAQPRIGKADAAYVAKIEVSSKPSTGDITLQKPTTSIPIKDVLKQLGLDTSAINSGLTSLATSSTSGDTQLNSSQSDFTVGQAKDTGRMIHIRELHGAVEAYYADVGHYPTLANLNDSTWLATNMKTLDKSYRLDPDFFGLTDPLVAKPTAGRYSYGPTKKDGVTPCIVATDCVSYKLVAILSDGTRFTKTSLN